MSCSFKAFAATSTHTATQRVPSWPGTFAFHLGGPKDAEKPFDISVSEEGGSYTPLMAVRENMGKQFSDP